MKKLFFASLAALILCANVAFASVGLLQLGSSAGGPLVILDDDGSDDIDNAADLRMFNVLAASNLITPVGYIAGDGDIYNSSAAKAMRNFSGLSYPIYAYQGSCCTDVGGLASWTEAVTNQFNPGDSRSNYINCEYGYRLLLAAAPRKVNIIAGGSATCLNLLLGSPANDNGDGLPTGVALIEAHVAQVIWAAGTWPSGNADPNMTYDTVSNPNSSETVLANWPSTVPFNFYPVNITVTSQTGPFPNGSCQTSNTDPYQLAFYTYYGSGQNPCVRYAWTQPMFLYVMHGLGTNFSVAGSDGTASYDPMSTDNTWASSPAGPFSYFADLAYQFQLQSQVCALEQIAGTNWCAASPSAYVGPGDVIPPTTPAVSAWIPWGSCARAFSNAQASAQAALCTVVDTATGLSSCTINAQLNGFANLTATTCGGVNIVTFCTVTHTGCSISEIYDYTGFSKNFVQATLANMPTLALSALNGLPCIGFNGSSQYLATPSVVDTGAQPYAFSAVAERIGQTSSYGGLISYSGNYPQMTFYDAPNTVTMYAGGGAPTASANDNAFHAFNFDFNDTSSYFFIDGVNTIVSTSPGTANLGATINLGVDGDNDYLDGVVCEAGFLPGGLGSLAPALNSNQHSAYGF